MELFNQTDEFNPMKLTNDDITPSKTSSIQWIYNGTQHPTILAVLTPDRLHSCFGIASATLLHQ